MLSTRLLRRDSLPALLGLTLAAFFAAPPAHAQSADDAFRFTSRSPGTNARLLGMGGAGIGGVADAGALFSNPAGMGYLKHGAFGGSLQFIGVTDMSAYTLPGASPSGQENSLNATRLGDLSYVYRAPTVRGSFAVGVGFTQRGTYERELQYRGSNGLNSFTDYLLPIGGEYEIDVDFGGDGIEGTEDDVFTPSFFRDLSFIGFETFGIDFDASRFDAGENPFLPAVAAGTVQQTGRVTEEGSSSEASLGFAVEAAENVMVGVSVNVPFSRYDFRRSFDELDIDNENDGANGTVDFDGLTFEQSLESTLVGIGLRAGVSTEIQKGLRAGFTIETPTYYVVEEDYRTTLETRFDNGDVFSYGFDAGQDAESGSFEYEITTPWRLGAGVAFERDGIGFLVDVEYIDWSQTEFSSETLFFDDLNFQLRDDFDAVVNVRAGAEYTLGALSLRAGFALEPDPRSESRDVAFSELDRDRQSFSFGVGYALGPDARLDIGWMQTRFDDLYRPYTEVDNAPFVTEEIERNRVSIGMTVRL